MLVRVPFFAGDEDVARFVVAHEDWILKKLENIRKQPKAKGPAGKKLTQKELDTLKKKARDYIPGRAAKIAEIMGLRYNRVSIRAQKTRWGSCSTLGNLNFNCLLMLAPAEVLDSVVVHELCHRKHMDHSPAFYAEVERVFPGYRLHHGWLKENGDRLLASLPL